MKQSCRNRQRKTDQNRLFVVQLQMYLWHKKQTNKFNSLQNSHCMIVSFQVELNDFDYPYWLRVRSGYVKHQFHSTNEKWSGAMSYGIG